MTARQRRRLRPRTIAAAVLAAAALVLTLAACGGSSESPSAVASIETTGSTDTESGDQEENSSAESDPQEVLLEFTQCLRDEGIDVEDPDFNGGGGPGGGGGPFGDVDMDDPEFQAAQETCGPILESLQQQFEPEDQEALQDAALEYAQCMRENGVEMEDPDFSNPGGGGPGGGGGPFGDVDRDDPDFQAADETCRAAFGGLRGPGQAGGDS